MDKLIKAEFNIECEVIIETLEDLSDLKQDILNKISDCSCIDSCKCATIRINFENEEIIDNK